MNLKLYQIEYCQNHVAKPVIKHIKAYKQTDAISVGIPYELNGQEQKIDSIKITVLCEMDEILNCTAKGTFEE